MLLSDASLQKRKGSGNHNSWLIFQQKDKEFVYHLWELFNTVGIVGALPALVKSTLSATGKTDYSYQFNTFALPFFTALRSQWFQSVDGKNIKVIPSNSLLTPVAFAYWLCGAVSFYKAKGAIAISTDSLRQEEVVLLRSLILQNLNIDSTRVSNGHGKNSIEFTSLNERSVRFNSW